MTEDLTEKQIEDMKKIKDEAGDFATLAEVKRAAAAIGIDVLQKKYGISR